MGAKPGKDANTTVMVSGYSDSDEEREVKLSKKAFVQLAKLKEIFHKSATGFNGLAGLHTAAYENTDHSYGYLSVWPTTLCWSRKTGLPKYKLRVEVEFKSPGKMAKAMNKAIYQLYDKVMDPDNILMYETLDPEENGKLGIIKEGKLQFGLE